MKWNRERTAWLPLVGAALLGLAGCAAEEPETRWEVRSPRDRLRLTLELHPADGAPGERTLRYALTDGAGARLLDGSPLGLRTTSDDLTRGLRVTDVARRDVTDSYTMLVGKRRQRSVSAAELKLGLAGEGDARLELIVRVHDDGVAYRYRLPGTGTVTVAGESSGFTVPAGARAFIAPYSLGPVFQGVYEQLYQEVAAGAPAPGKGWAYPALFALPGGARWLLVTEADLDASYNGTRLHETPTGGRYRVRFPDESEGYGKGPTRPTSALPLTTPWRVVIAGSLSDVVQSTLVDDLSRESTLAGETGWIAPGRAAWSWLTQNTGTPQLQRSYVDYAAGMGWEYVLVDANWDDWPGGDAAVKDLVTYAAGKGVRILLWYNSGGDHTVVGESPRDRMDQAATRRAEMSKIAGWGVAGVKVDFFESDKQDRIAQFIGILRDAADHRLLVNFHGCTLPRGWQRTYPHLMSHEAVQGAEYYRTGGGPHAIDNVRYAFTRNVVGSMDYTPVTFALAHKHRQLSYAHQLALPVVFESGITHFGDRADGVAGHGFAAVFAASPAARKLLAAIPTAWDETRLLQGHPRTHVVLARRSGKTWYVGALAGQDTARELALPLDFLGPGRHTGTLIGAGASATELASRALDVTAADTLEHTLGPRDGMVAVLRPDAS